MKKSNTKSSAKNRKATTSKKNKNLSTSKIKKSQLIIAALVIALLGGAYFTYSSFARNNTYGPGVVSQISGFHNLKGVSKCTHGAGKAPATVRQGSRGDCVKVVQHSMNLWIIRNRPSNINGLAGDGIFGSQTAQAVRAYQRAYSLKADGVVGNATWNHILNNCVMSHIGCGRIPTTTKG